MPSQISNFGPFFTLFYLISTLNLRPELNSVAFLTYIVKFSAFKLVSFMAYTNNIQGWQDGTRYQPWWWPLLPSPVTATPWQPHSLTTLTWSTFNIISINYDNYDCILCAWRLSVNWEKIYSILLSVTCHGLRTFPHSSHALVSICEFLKPCELLFFELESLVKCWMWIRKKFTQ